MQAVLTGDIIDSTKYSKEDLNTILNTINKEFSEFSKKHKADFKLFKGDSFQGVVLEPHLALQLALLLKTSIGSVAIKGSSIPDFRMAIGIGTIDLERASILESNGEAFQFSGRTLEAMKGDYPRILLKTDNEQINNEFDVHFSFLDSISSKWSRESAEVVYYLLQNFKEREIAEQLGIYQSAVNQRKKVAHWDSVSMLLKRYKSVISDFTHGK